MHVFATAFPSAWLVNNEVHLLPSGQLEDSVSAMTSAKRVASPRLALTIKPPPAAKQANAHDKKKKMKPATTAQGDDDAEEQEEEELTFAFSEEEVRFQTLL